jgi:hypothetical protein
LVGISLCCIGPIQNQKAFLGACNACYKFLKM